MAPITRAGTKFSSPSSSSLSSSFPRRRTPLLLPCEQDSSSSSEEQEEEEEEEEEGHGNRQFASTKRSSSKAEDIYSTAATATATASLDTKGKAPITITLRKLCKVCKGTGHQAGFRGATYIDCPQKPCFLCKLPGHTTMTCPHRVAMEHGVLPAPRRSTKTSLDFVFDRQLHPKIPMIKPAFVIPNQVECGLIRFHSRRVTCLEFHPTKSGVLLSGDKKGQLGIWDYVKLHEKTVYESIHSCILNNMKFNPMNDGTLYTSSSDGTVSCTDLETGMPFLLIDLNPEGWNGPASWRMLYGLDVNSEKGLLLVADNFGYLYLLDARSNRMVSEAILIHKRGSKVVGLHCNPFQPDLLLSCGNDHFARLWDIRRLEGGSLSNLAHSRVVNSAYFSPKTGSKILTTSQDNRIRVWDSIFSNLERPTREIVHSHDFNRHLTPFRAEWDPKDHSESLAVIGRYISENYNGVALHPIDFIDISTGQLVAEVTEPDLTTITPVNKLHPVEDILASGSSRSLFIWKPKEDFEFALQKGVEKQKQFIIEKQEKKKSCGKFDGENDDDDDYLSKGKKLKAKKQLKQA